MSIPTYDRFIEPILRFLASQPDGSAANAAHEAAAHHLGLSDEDKALILPSGVQRIYKNRAGWAHDRLKRAGLSSSPKHGYWKLTAAGVDFAKANPAPLPETAVQRLASDFLGVVLKPAASAGQLFPKAVEDVVQASSAISATPDDQLEAAIAELKRVASDNLLERLAGVKGLRASQALATSNQSP